MPSHSWIWRGVARSLPMTRRSSTFSRPTSVHWPLRAFRDALPVLDRAIARRGIARSTRALARLSRGRHRMNLGVLDAAEADIRANLPDSPGPARIGFATLACRDMALLRRMQIVDDDREELLHDSLAWIERARGLQPASEFINSFELSYQEAATLIRLDRFEDAERVLKHLRGEQVRFGQAHAPAGYGAQPRIHAGAAGPSRGGHAGVPARVQRGAAPAEPRERRGARARGGDRTDPLQPRAGSHGAGLSRHRRGDPRPSPARPAGDSCRHFCRWRPAPCPTSESGTGVPTQITSLLTAAQDCLTRAARRYGLAESDDPPDVGTARATRRHAGLSEYVEIGHIEARPRLEYRPPGARRGRGHGRRPGRRRASCRGGPVS